MRLSIFLLLTTLACASSTQSTELAPTPFNAAQIRDATQPGRSYLWRITANGQTIRSKLTFVEVDAAGAKTEALRMTDDGTPMSEPEVQTETWEGFVKHASWPKDATTISDAKIAVGAGEFDCMLYTITEAKDGKTQVTRAWFAKDLPGAPVKLLVEMDGQEVMSLELLDHQPGGQ